MNDIVRRIYLVGLLVILALIVVHAPLSVFLGTQFPAYDLLAKSWKELLVVALIPVTALYITTMSAWRQLVRDPILWMATGYGVLHMILAAWTHDGLATLAGLAIDLRYVAYFVLVYILLRLSPQYRPLFIKIGVIGAGVVIGFASLQLFVLPADILTYIGYGPQTIAPYLTVDDNADFVRINSTLRGPNPLGAYMAVVLAVAIAARLTGVIRQRIWIALLATGALVTLFVTYSRSSVLAVWVAVLTMVGVLYGKRIKPVIWGVIGVSVVVIVGLVFALRDTSFVANVILHDDPSTGAVVTSDQQHTASLADGVDRMIRQPFGAGIGSTGSASLYGDTPLVIENQYLFVAHESGWLGLVLFVALFVMIMVRLWHRRDDWLALGVFASGVGLALAALVQPVWADDTVSIVWWGMAAVAIAKEAYGRQSTNKKAV